MNHRTLLVILAILFAPARLLAEDSPARATSRPADSAGFHLSDRIVAGGPEDDVEVRHLVLRGSNQEIGRKLAEIARERYGARPARSKDPLVTRAQRRFLAVNYPILLERAACVAADGPSIIDLVDTIRTLWHSVYIPERRSMEVEFYLGDKKPDEATDGTSGSRRSGYIRFELRP